MQLNKKFSLAKIAFCIAILFLVCVSRLKAQEKDSVQLDGTLKMKSDTIPDSLLSAPDTLFIPLPDTPLKISNFNPYFSIHVDSVLNYKLLLNKSGSKYHWYLKKGLAGLKMSEDGILSMKLGKEYFLSGMLKYNHQYDIAIGVQNLNKDYDRIDTTISLLFYNTTVIYPSIKTGIIQTSIEEGDTLKFMVQCEEGNFKFETVSYYSNFPLMNASKLKSCNDEFSWTPEFDFVKETDSLKQKIVQIYFVASASNQYKDTAVVRVVVKNALNYHIAVEEHKQIIKAIKDYMVKLKYTFLITDKQLRKTKKTRTVMDISSASTATLGTILSSINSEATKLPGKILPSVGLTMVPVKEALAPQKIIEQNQANLIRNSIKRLEYMLYDNALVGDKDYQVATKTTKLKDELKQSQMQLLDVPLEVAYDISERELNDYYNNTKVNKKYRLRK